MNQAFADVVAEVAAGGRGRARPGPAPVPAGRPPGRAPARPRPPSTSATRPSPGPTTLRGPARRAGAARSCSSGLAAPPGRAASTPTAGGTNFQDCFEAEGSSPPPTFVSPLGPDAADITAVAAGPAGAAALAALAEQVGDRQVITRVDRIELSKNIVRGFLAYEELLDQHPEWRERGRLRRPRLPVPGGRARLRRLPRRGRGRRSPGSTSASGPPTGRRSSTTTSTTSPARSPPCAGPTSCWSTPSATA